MTAYFQTLRILLRKENMLLGTLVLNVGKLGQGVHLISHARVLPLTMCRSTAHVTPGACLLIYWEQHGQ